MSDILMPKGPGMQGPKDAVMERLRRRIACYRKHHDDCEPRFEHTVNGLNDRQKQDTQVLQQRFLESKSKKSAKKSDKNKQEGSNNSSTPKVQKRHSEDIDMSSGGNPALECYEPPTKISVCGSVNGSATSNATTGPFKHHQSQTQSPNNLKSQLPSTNCKNTHPNSKALANTNLKPGNGPAVPQIGSPISDHRAMGMIGSANSSYPSSTASSIEFKTEPNSAFVDLDQCAAALEKDAAENGSIMSALIGDVANDGMINYDTLKDLISEISDNPDFMKDFDDFEDDHSSKNISVGLDSAPNHLHSTNTNPCAENSANFGGHGLSRTPPAAPVTPTTSSPRLSQVKMESDSNSTGHSTDNGCGNRGLSHCAGPSPAAASTASPLASQLSAHHPSQTPPYSSGSAMFDSASPSGAQGQTNPLTPNSNSSYCPASSISAPHNSVVAGINTKGTRIPYTSPGSLALDSPAAQTLKQMAEQHQHKTQLGISNFKSNPGSSPSPARSPFSGESYGGFGGSGEFANTGNINVNNSSNSSNYSNVSVRTQSGGISSVSGVSDNMALAMPIKQETSMYSPQSTFPTMDIKRKNVNANHGHIPQQAPPPPAQTQHKICASNPTRLPNSAIMQSQQQPPLYSNNKSFTHTNSSGNQLGPNVNTNVNALQPYMNRPQNPGLSSVPPNNYPPTSHSGYPGNSSHSTVQMSPAQQMSISQANTASLPVSTSGSQQWDINTDPKSASMAGTTQPQNFYYQNQGVSPHSQMQVSSNIHAGGNNQDQTINFTQQHLRMSTGTAQGMNRIVGPGSGPAVPSNAAMARMNLPSRMTNQPCPGQGMNDISMSSRMEMQQRMMRHQQVRSQSMQQQQGMMMRPPGPGEMGAQQQIIGGQNPAATRFPSLNPNSSVNSGPGRPGPVAMMGGVGPGHVPNPNISNLRMQQNMYGPGHSTGSHGASNSLPMGGNISMNSMPIRRLPSYGPNDVVPNPTTNMPRPGGSMSMMMPSEPQQQSMTSSSDWMGMPDPSIRNYPGASMQQPPRQAMRPNPSSFHPAMAMQMAQQQSHHGINQLQRADVAMCGIGPPVQVSGQPGMGGNPMGNMGYSQQQQISVGGNPGNFSQPPIAVNKTSQPQANMCVSSNFTMKSGGGMAISNSTGSGGTMMCANSQSVNQMGNPVKSNSEVENQDFGFDLLDNMSSTDPPFNSESDFLSTFVSNPNYHSMLNTL